MQSDVGACVSQQLASLCACSPVLRPRGPGTADVAKPRHASDEVDSCGAESESGSLSPVDLKRDFLQSEAFYRFALGEGDC